MLHYESRLVTILPIGTQNCFCPWAIKPVDILFMALKTQFTLLGEKIDKFHSLNYLLRYCLVCNPTFHASQQ
jgi:hypothetical protein